MGKLDEVRDMQFGKSKEYCKKHGMLMDLNARKSLKNFHITAWPSILNL